VICVDSPDEVPPVSSASLAQRRIELLAIEQNAWVLAGRDRRCVVVETRTELDWAMKHDQICVWAPSKIVLDAVDGPETTAQSAAALSHWFANQLAASALIYIGDVDIKDFDSGLARQIGVQCSLDLVDE
jgi:dihydroneopterin aldolase